VSDNKVPVSTTDGACAFALKVAMNLTLKSRITVIHPDEDLRETINELN